MAVTRPVGPRAERHYSLRQRGHRPGRKSPVRSHFGRGRCLDELRRGSLEDRTLKPELGSPWLKDATGAMGDQWRRVVALTWHNRPTISFADAGRR